MPFKINEINREKLKMGKKHKIKNKEKNHREGIQ